jgi:LmbE family N-acetylglucosaminyl deacetylase
VAVPALGRILAISPHLDDAVLSAGALLSAHPGSAMLTVFAGIPASYGSLTEWDAAGGFSTGDDVVGLRRDEDRRAARRLAATARWLDFLDDQYAVERPSADAVAAAIRQQVADLEVDTIAFPLGVGHSDHERTHEACVALLGSNGALARHWVVWADIPYRARHPELFANRVESMRTGGLELEPFGLDADDRKRAAVAEYSTQARALGPHNMMDVERPEQLYLIGLSNCAGKPQP